MQPDREPDRPHRPGEDTDALLAGMRLRSLTGFSFLPGTWRDKLGCLAMLIVLALAIWGLQALGLFH
jgi:hypothetical protein